MVSKPSYEELARRVVELEDEVDELRRAEAALERKESRAREAEQMALLGHWELDLATDTLFWSDEIYRIFGLTPGEFGATYEAFLEAVHPDDRELVNRAYTRSVEERTGYDIVHRLRLHSGAIKYVQERCKTEYDDEGRPLRSLGTVQDITAQVRAQQSFAGIIGRAPQMQEVFQTIRDLAEVNAPVLIQGESGTGKELVAVAIHSQGHRATRPFVPINCSALPEGLLESELFGHVRGAFTGAIRDKRGRFELADSGTLFLDEVADLPKLVQAKLLRVLQEGTFERVGDEKTRLVDVRVISAANRDLRREVELGNFREDLFYRLRVVPIELPPLRARINDIPLLVERLLEQAAREGQHSEGISREAVALLLDYDWPGNVRELQSALRFALIKARGGAIEPEHLPRELGRPGTATPAKPPPELALEQPPRQGPRRAGKLDRQAVQRALETTRGNKVKAARVLGVGRATLYRYLKDNPL